MDVLPTDWSPRKTSLYLASGASDVPPLALLDPFLDDDSDGVLIIIILFMIRAAVSRRKQTNCFFYFLFYLSIYLVVCCCDGNDQWCSCCSLYVCFVQPPSLFTQKLGSTKSTYYLIFALVRFSTVEPGYHVPQVLYVQCTYELLSVPPLHTHCHWYLLFFFFLL